MKCKKISCYMRDSACRWFIVKRAKIFWHINITLKIFEFSRLRENVEIWLVFANKLFWITQSYFSNDIMKQTYCQLLCLAFKTFNEEKKFLGKCHFLTVIISLSFNETKKIRLFYLHCPCETLLSNQVRRI